MEKYLAMSKKENQDDQRLYQCISKYDKIVNQFDELINMVDMVTKPPKRHRGLSYKSRSNMVSKTGGRGGAEKRSCNNGSKGSTSCSTGSGDDNQSGGEILVQLITNHLLDLKAPHNA